MGVLPTDPLLQKLSLGQLIFAAHSVRRQQQATFDITAKALKMMLVSLLGLNALKPVDENGLPKSYEQMTPEERESFMPLIAWVARPEVLKAVHDQHTAADAVAAADNDREYQKLVEEIDAAGGDMEPIIGIHEGLKINTNINSAIDDAINKHKENISGGSQSVIGIEEV